MKTPSQEAAKSLEEQYLELFKDDTGAAIGPRMALPRPPQMRVVQSITTYSACEAPILISRTSSSLLTSCPIGMTYSRKSKKK